MFFAKDVESKVNAKKLQSTIYFYWWPFLSSRSRYIISKLHINTNMRLFVSDLVPRNKIISTALNKTPESNKPHNRMTTGKPAVPEKKAQCVRKECSHLSSNRLDCVQHGCIYKPRKPAVQPLYKCGPDALLTDQTKQKICAEYTRKPSPDPTDCYKEKVGGIKCCLAFPTEPGSPEVTSSVVIGPMNHPYHARTHTPQ